MLLRQVLRIGARDAAGRVRLAAAVTPRRTLTGEPVEAAHPQTAAALAEGAISTRHAITVVATADRISDFVADTAGPLFETQLLDCAREHDPDTLARFAHDLYSAVDQDGAFRDIEAAHRRREVSLHRRADGSATHRRRADLRSGRIPRDPVRHPRPNPTKAPTVNATRARRVSGATTRCSAGSKSSTPPARCRVRTAAPPPWCSPRPSTSTRTAPASPRPPTATRSRPRSPTGGWTRKPKPSSCCCRRPEAIVAYSDQHRLFTEQQRLAMFARDKGCSYPGCDAPLSWTQAHHVTDYAITRRTCGRRRHPCLHRQPRPVRTHGLEIDHAQRPTPLGPASLGRPRPETETQHACTTSPN